DDRGRWRVCPLLRLRDTGCAQHTRPGCLGVPPHAPRGSLCAYRTGRSEILLGHPRQFHRDLRRMERLEGGGATISGKSSQGEPLIMKKLIMQAAVAATLVLVALGAHPYKTPRVIVPVRTIPGE